ncbi:MAG: cytochrome c oxidase subunit 3 family protein, partial [Mycobacterium sp.]
MSTTTTPAPAATRPRRLPGEPGIWVFAILDMLIFAEMFGIYGWYRADQYEAFQAAQDRVI